MLKIYLLFPMLVLNFRINKYILYKISRNYGIMRTNTDSFPTDERFRRMARQLNILQKLK
jgi:hypothetical protein